MGRVEPKFRKPLNVGQLRVLKLLYKFRFITTELVARYDGVSDKRVIFSRVSILYKQGYIGRHYDNSYKIDRKKAVYFLLPKGMKALKELPDFSTQIINSIYKDKVASEQFRERCLALFSTCNRLKTLYGDKLKFFTKSDLVAFDYFPKPRPDAYIKLETAEGSNKQFFLDYYDLATPFFLHRRKIEKYVGYEEGGDWDVTRMEFPAIIGVCETVALQKRVGKRMLAAVDGSLYSEVKFYVADLKTIAVQGKSDDKLWTLVGEATLESLDNIA